MKLTPAPILPPLLEDEYAELRASIAELGVQVPLMVTDAGTIIDGHERHRIIVELGIRRFPLRVVGRLDEQRRRELAVRLNVERRHLTPTQRRLLIEAELRSDPARTDRALGELFHCDHKTIGSARRRLEATGEIPQLAKVARNGKVFKPPVVGVETLAAAREAGRLLQALGEDPPGGGLTLRDVRKAAWEERYRMTTDVPTAKLPSAITIKRCDFRKLPVEDGSADLILTDPMWSVHESHLHGPMAESFARWLKPGGVLLCYTGNASLPMFLDAFRAVGLKYQWLLGAASIPADERPVPYGTLRLGGKFSAALRPLLLFSKGNTFRTHKTPTDIVFTRGRDERTHPLNWQQPLDEARYFVEHFSAPGSLCCDPFLGSGTTAVAVALEGQGRRFIGGDCDATCVKIARRRVSEAMGSLATP